MNINILSISNSLSKWEEEGLTYYSKQFPKNINLNFINIKNKINPNHTIEKIIKEEANEISKRIKPANAVIACDSNGQQYNSIEFSNKLQNIYKSYSNIDFIIGGSHGLDKTILEASNEILSFSKFTFPHRLFKLILTEQLYRAFSIVNNKPYHK
jgi:23S rRNA (pseudouridine1915-N3)-methyltransferase